MIQTRVIKRMHCDRIVFVPQRRNNLFLWKDYQLGSAFHHFETLDDAILFIVSRYPHKSVKVHV